jgi:hypothetical protein
MSQHFDPDHFRQEHRTGFAQNQQNRPESGIPVNHAGRDNRADDPVGAILIEKPLHFAGDLVV